MIDFRSNNRRIDEIEGSCKRERFEGSQFLGGVSSPLFIVHFNPFCPLLD
jgi:hypothetical protein